MTATLLRDLFGFNPGNLWRRLSLFVLVLLVVGVPEWRALADPPGRLIDGHAITAIELAMTRSFCGAPSAYPPPYRVPHYVRDHPEDAGKPLREVARDMAGSVENYCGAVSQPFLNNENSLTLIQAWLLRLEPNLSLEALGRRLHALRIAMLIFFAATFVAGGASIFVSVTAGSPGCRRIPHARESFLFAVPFSASLPAFLVRSLRDRMVVSAIRPLGFDHCGCCDDWRVDWIRNESANQLPPALSFDVRHRSRICDS